MQKPPKNERWYDIPGYEEQYQISPQGRVRGLTRIDNSGHLRPIRLLRFSIRPNGRRYFSLTRMGIGRTFCASMLMAKAYGIANPRRCEYVIHRNRDNSNFRRENLQWATLAEQRIHDGLKTRSPYYGVSSTGSSGVLKWVATVIADRRRHEVGYFPTAEAAAYAYDCEVERRGLKRALNRVPKPKAFRQEIPSLPGERWRPFPGAEETHMISNQGRVRTLAYVARDGRRVLPKLRKITVASNGFRSIAIAQRRYGIEKAMAQAFPGKLARISVS